jgi:arylsulfatase A-like enzyme
MVKFKKIIIAVLIIAAGKLLCASKKPNFVIILTDDQYVGIMGHEGNSIVQTPNLDKMAEQGVRFTNAHVTSAICTPSRISIFLSQYERKHGVNFNSGSSVSDEAWEKSYPVILRENGYYTGYVGKNHSPVGKGGYESGLMENSFDYWYGAHQHLTFYPKTRHPIFEHAEDNTQVEILEEGVNDFLSNERSLEKAIHSLDSLPADKPFCLSICFNLPHDVGTGTMKQRESDPEIYKSLYRDKEIPLPKHYVAKSDITTPKLPPDLLKAEKRQNVYDYVDKPETNKERITRQMQAMTGIDKLLGKLRKQLEEKGFDKNTIIFFISDHGLFMGQFGLGGKSLCYEVVTHVPFIIYNPLSKTKARGKQLDNLVQTIDIAPTMLDYAGIDIPGSFQGKSIRPLLEGKEQKVREYSFSENLWGTLCCGNPRCESVQDKEWKYIRYYENNMVSAFVNKKADEQQIGLDMDYMPPGRNDPEFVLYRISIENPLNGEKPVYEELYNLKNDPDETTNLAKEEKYSSRLNKMRAVWEEKINFARGNEAPKVFRDND